MTLNNVAPFSLEGETAVRNPLVAWRERMGWTQAQLARALGVARSTVMRWENGDRPRAIEHPTVLRLALERLEDTMETYYVAFSSLNGGTTRVFLARGTDRGEVQQAAHAEIDRLFPNRGRTYNDTLRANLRVLPRYKARLEFERHEAEGKD